jgi:hypothetical protein
MGWEQETIINFAEGEDECDIYTHSEKWIKRLEEVMKVTPYQVHPDGAKSFKISKKRLTLPRAKMEMSDEKRQAVSERFKKIREGKLVATVEDLEDEDEE